MNLTNQELQQAITDGLGGLAIALSNQLDPQKLATDLRNLAANAEQQNKTPSAGLLNEIARTVEVRFLSGAAHS